MMTLDVLPDRSVSELALARLLAHRYGDGLVYLGDGSERPVFDAAVRLGYVNAEGYVTPAGRTLLARHEDD